MTRRIGIDRDLGLTARLAGCLVDPRDPSRATHTLADLVAQRVYGLACGYADPNDADRPAADPIQNLGMAGGLEVAIELPFYRRHVYDVLVAIVRAHHERLEPRVHQLHFQ